MAILAYLWVATSRIESIPMTKTRQEEIWEAILTLGLDGEDTLDAKTVRRAYATYARQWHPDIATQRGVSEEVANRRMAEGNNASSVLKKAIDDNGGSYKVVIPSNGNTQEDPTPKTSRDDQPCGDYWQTHTTTSHHADSTEQTQDSATSANAKTSVPSDNPANRTNYPAWWQEMLGDIFKSVGGGYPFRMASLPVKILRLLNLSIELFFLYLLVRSAIAHPILTVLIIPILLFEAWVYRGIARIVFQIAELSDGIALALDIALIAGIAYRYGSLIVAVISSAMTQT